MDEAAVAELLGRKLRAARALFAVTQQELLVVDLEDIEPLLERKEQLIAEIGHLDAELAAHGGEEEVMAVQPDFVDTYREVVEAALENEQAMEARLADERTRLAQELQEFEHHTRLRQYLDNPRASGGTVNLKK